MNLKRTALGSFQQTSTQMAATDPCYDSDVPNDIRGILSNVKTGTWNAYAVSSKHDSSVMELQVLHESCSPESGDSSVWMRLEGFQVGVDSGQAGFFDNAKYPYGNLGEYSEKESFYRKASELTIDGAGGIVDNFGAVTSSGDGDGCYECYALYDDQDGIVGAKIIFLDTDSENDLEIEV